MCKCDGPSSGGELRSSFGNCAVEGCTPFQSQLELRSLTRSRINQSIKKLPATQHSLRAVAVCAMNATMRGGAVLILLGITTLAAYSVGRQDAPANEPPVAFAAPTAVARSTAQPVAFTTPAVEQAAPAPLSTPAPQKPATDVPAKPESKRKVEAVLTAAAITASSSKQAGTNTTPPATPAPVLTTGHGMAALAAVAALTPDRLDP